jgi:hypothetical protein
VIGLAAYQVGHPAGFRKKLVDGYVASVRSVSTWELDFFRANLDSWRGHSGSPVLMLGASVGILVDGPLRSTRRQRQGHPWYFASGCFRMRPSEAATQP